MSWACSGKIFFSFVNNYKRKSSFWFQCTVINIGSTNCECCGAPKDARNQGDGDNEEQMAILQSIRESQTNLTGQQPTGLDESTFFTKKTEQLFLEKKNKTMLSFFY